MQMQAMHPVRPLDATPPRPLVSREARRRQAGFTLIEIVIVMAIIALLASLVAPQVFGKLADSKVKVTHAQVELLVTAIDSFVLDNGRPPTQEEGIQALIQAPRDLPRWSGPYLRKRELPKDGWNNSFVYEYPGKRSTTGYDLYSLGSDGKPGGTDENADIGNW